MKEQVRQIFDEQREVTQATADALSDKVADVSRCVADALRQGHKVLLFGNGGSAADAQHVAGELVARFKREREGWPVIALTTDASVLTAIGNDYGYERVFERQVEALVARGDLVIGISTSGNAENVLRGIAAAKQRGATTVGLTGAKGDRLEAAVDICLKVPSENTPRIQEMHITMLHVVCELVERDLAVSK